VGLYYLVLVLLFTYLVNLLEKRLQRKETNSVQVSAKKKKEVSL
ncbi:amino acid ABC transporter permease, partial [Vibrio cholerae]|nr:amino acid ABC transporter permease [Vibrio cholerae]